jgi:hypothetical protein
VTKGDAPPDDTHRKVYGDGFTAANPGPDRSAGLWAADEKAFARWRAEALPGRIAAVKALRETHPAALSPDEQTRLHRVQSRTVMICTPIARAPVWQYTTALLETSAMLNQLGVKYYYASVVGSSNLPRVRNILVAKFLASDATDLVFIDDDIGWQATDVVRLLASDQPLIAGISRKKNEASQDAAGWCCEFLPDSDHGLVVDAMGNVEVARAATGFMRIERGVFQEMIRAHPDWKGLNVPESTPAEQQFYYRFFAYDEYEATEDYVFCDRWRGLGGSVFIDPSIKLTHAGEKAYTGAIIDLIRIRPETEGPPPE